MAQLSVSGQGNAFRGQQRNAHQREPSRRLPSDNESFTFGSIGNANQQQRTSSLGDQQPRGSSFGANNDRMQQGTYEGFDYSDSRGASVETGAVGPITNPMAPSSSAKLAPGSVAVASSEEKEKAKTMQIVIDKHGSNGSTKAADSAARAKSGMREFETFIKDMGVIVKNNISIATYSSDDLLTLKENVYKVRELLGQIDLARRLQSLRMTIKQVSELDKGGNLTAATIMDAVELADKILEAQGNCEAANLKVGGFGEAPHLSVCAPLLFLYRLVVPDSIRQMILDSGWATITTLNEDSLADADMGINAMGIICALIMTVPFGLLSGAGPGFFDELAAAIDTCTGRWTDPETKIIYPCTDYGWTYQGIRKEFLAYITLCIFASLDCVVISTLYYVFHRGGEKDPRKLHHWWRSRGYLIVVVCGVCTITAITALFATTKTVFVYYSVALAPKDVLLDSWWNRPANATLITTPLTDTDFGATQSVFQNAGEANPLVGKFVSPVCSTNSLEFGVPGALSLLAAISLGLYFVF